MSDETKQEAKLPALQEAPAIGSAELSVFFGSGPQFEHAQRVASALCRSSLVPTEFHGNVANTLIALDMAQRLKANPMAIMQNIYVVHGKPSWSAQFVIAMVNSCGRFDPLRFREDGTGDNKTCVAWTKIKGTDSEVESPPVSMAMAKAEGWLGKNGSKWKTMPDLMLRYRAATFFGRLYCPELLMGMKTTEEVIDVHGEPIQASPVETVKRLASTLDDENRYRAQAGHPPTSGEAPPEPAKTPQAQLADSLVSAGMTFDDFKQWCSETGNDEAADVGSFDELPTAFAKRMLSARAAVISSFIGRKGGGK